MSRDEFLRQLEQNLQIGAGEKEEVMNYYREYFEEAGPENEAAVLAELGDPVALAKKLTAECESEMGQGEAGKAGKGAEYHGSSDGEPDFGDVIDNAVNSILKSVGGLLKGVKKTVQDAVNIDFSFSGEGSEGEYAGEYAESDTSAWGETFSEVNEELRAANEELAYRTEELNTAQEEFNDAESELNDARDELSDAESELADVQAEEMAAVQAVESARNQVQAVLAAIEQAKAQLNAVETNGLFSEEPVEEELLSELEDQLAEAEDELADAESELRDVSGERRGAEREVRSAQREVRAAERARETAQRELERAARATEETGAKVEQLNRQIIEMRKNAEEKEAPTGNDARSSQSAGSGQKSVFTSLKEILNGGADVQQDVFSYHNMDMMPFTDVCVDVNNCPIKVERSVDGRYGVDVRLVVRKQEQTDGRTSSQDQIVVNVVDGKLIVRRRRMPGLWRGFASNHEKEYVKLYLPEAEYNTIELRTGNSPVNVQGLNNVKEQLKISTGNASVHVTDVMVYGSLIADTSNGPIKLQQVFAQEISADTSNSSMVLERVVGDRIVADTSNGGIKVVECEAAQLLHADTSNGSIEAVIRGTESDWMIHADTSNAKIYVNGKDVGREYHWGSGEKEIRLDTSNGRITIGFVK